MSGVLNDCDALLQAASVRFLVGAGVVFSLTPNAPGFHLNSAGVPDLSKVTVIADLAGINGSVAFSVNGGTLSNVAARSADVTYTGSAAIVTATVVAGGETFTRSLVIPVLRDGAAGTNGTNGSNGVSPNKNGVAFLYKWSTATPTKPAGTSTFGWSTASNTAYAGNDGWSITVPSNPGTPLIQLFVASVAVTDVAVATMTTVSYANSIVAAWAQNGANGANGVNGTTGVQSGEAKVYQWAATIPAGPVGSPTFAWSTATFGAAPANWTLTPGTAPSPGMTLWMACAGVTDSAAATTTAFNWTAASILAVGYAGANGTNGSNGADGDDGAEGVSYVTAYCASATATTSTAPANTTGKTSVPAVNGGGIAGTWSKTVPALAAGQFMYQSDGLYNPATNQVIWSIPYWSSLKVGTLSAITANLGAITGGSIDIGSGNTSWHVDAQGNMWIGAAAFAGAPFRVSNTGAMVATNMTLRSGNVDMLTPSGLQPGFEAPNTKNGELLPNIAAASGVTLVGRGVTVVGNSATKNYAVGWNADCYSTESYSGGCYVSVVPENTGALDAMFGLNDDPINDNNLGAGRWESLNYAMDVLHSGAIHCFESGANVGQIGFFAYGNMLSIEYDGAQVRYLKDGAVLRTVAAAPNQRFHFDSSFNIDGSKLSKIRFGPLSSTAAGAQALAAIPNINTAIADKLSKTATSILSAPVYLQSSGAIVVGSANDGVTVAATGIAARKAGIVTFSVGYDGTAVFSGQLVAASGSFGAVEIANGGYLRQGATNYYQGAGFWWGTSGGVPKMHIGSPGVSCMYWNGSELVIEKARVDNPVYSAFSVSAGGTWSASGRYGSVDFGSRTASITGIENLESIVWTIDYDDRRGSFYLVNANSQTVSLSYDGPAPGQSATLTATIYGKDQRVTRSTVTVNATILSN